MTPLDQRGVNNVFIATLLERMATRAGHTHSTAEEWREAASFMRSVDEDMIELLDGASVADVANATSFNVEIAAALLEAACTGRIALLDALDAADPLYAGRGGNAGDDEDATSDDGGPGDLDEEGELMFAGEHRPRA